MSLFRKPTAIGARLSERGVELGEVRFQGERASFVRVAESAFASGAFERGEIKDPKDVAEAIRRARTAAPGGAFSGNAAHAILPDVATYVHVFAFPGFVSDKELMTAVAFQAEEVLPVDLAELVWRAHVVKRGAAGTTVRFSAVPRRILLSYADAFSAAGFSLASLGLESEAVDRACRFSRDLKEGARLVVDLSEETASAFLYTASGVRASFSQISLRPQSLFEQDAAPVASPTKKKKAARRPKAPPRLPHVRADRLNDLAFRTDAILDWFDDVEPATAITGVYLLASEAQAEIAEGLKSRLIGERPKLTVEVPDVFAQVENTPVSQRLRAEGKDLAFAHVLGAAAMGARPLGGEADFVSEPRRSPFAFLGALAAAPGEFFRRSTPNGNGNGNAKPESKPPKVETEANPNGPRRRPASLVGAVLLALLALAGIGFLVWNLRARQAEPAQTAASFAAFEREASVGVDGETADLPGRRFAAAAIPRERTITPSQTVVKEGKASGSVTLVNETGRTYDLVATTRLLSESGVLFRLRDAVRVPAGGTADAVAVADEPGPAGDIGPSRFTLPGLSPSAQSQMYARSDASMSGGGGAPVGVVTDQEIAAAVEEMRLELAADAGAALAPQDGAAGFAFLAPWTRVTAVRIESDPPSGTEAASFVVRAFFDLEAFGIDRRAAEDLALAGVAERLGVDPLDVDPDSLSVELRAKEVAPDFRTGTVILGVVPIATGR